MSWWTSLRDTVESVASVAGNFFVPGSSVLTSKLTSQGSQDQLNSGLGQVAQIGSSLYGGYQMMDAASSGGSAAASAGDAGQGAIGEAAAGQAAPAAASSAGGSIGGQIGSYMADATGMGTAAGWGTAANAIGGLALQAGTGALGQALAGGLPNSTNPTQGNAAATAADPFAAQRGQYMTALNSLMGGSTSTGSVGAGSQQAQGAMMNLASGQSTSQGGQLLSQMTQMLQPGNNFQATDPSYQFRLQQGTENVNRGAAKSGLLDSGNRLAALQDYGQGTASTEYQNQFARLQSGAGTALNAQGQQFGQFNTIDQNAQATQQNNYTRLAALSGSGIGSPSAAGGYVQGQIAGAAAQGQQLATGIVGAAKSLWGAATSPSAATPTYTAPDMSSMGSAYDPSAGWSA